MQIYEWPINFLYHLPVEMLHKRRYFLLMLYFPLKTEEWTIFLMADATRRLHALPAAVQPTSDPSTAFHIAQNVVPIPNDKFSNACTYVGKAPIVQVRRAPVLVAP